MKPSIPSGLWIGLTLALVVVAIVSLCAGAAPAALLPSGATASATTVATSAVLTPAKTSTLMASGSQATATRTPAPASATPVRTAPVASSSRPTPTSTPTVTAASEIIGWSVESRAIWAHRIGQGPIKVVLVGGMHGEAEANTHQLAEQLLAHFASSADEVPPGVSLWIVPNANPDGLAADRRWNADGVDLNRNADTDLDGCARNDWSPDTVGWEGDHPGAGGTYPFSEPESRALRQFLADAWIVVFYHSEAGAIYADTCQRHLPSAQLAESLAAGTHYPVPPEGWSGYKVTGDWVDYLSGEGVASAEVELTSDNDTEFERNLSGVKSLLANAQSILSAEATRAGAELVWLDESTVGAWRFPDNSFSHPLALEVTGDAAYLLDAGRVLGISLDDPALPQVLLAPGDLVENVPVIEPLDLAADGTSLLVLDRAGDVYRYSLSAHAWGLERYGRQLADSSDHYYVALAAASARYLLEATHERVWRFAPGEKGTEWASVAQGRDVDVGATPTGVFVLTRALSGPQGTLAQYKSGKAAPMFKPNADIVDPRQVVTGGTSVYVLDRAGRRVLRMAAATGALVTEYQFTDRRSVGAIWVGTSESEPAGAGDHTNTVLILAGRDTLYFYGQPGRKATIPGVAQEAPQVDDPAVLEILRGLTMPIEGATITRRDFQLPGAPRHYRLGVHEGIDFYGSTTGVQIDRQTRVRAVADGVVISATIGYEPLTAAESQALSAKCRALRYTPADVLDRYRGMQIWIMHSGGLVSRYAHLSSIAPGIRDGVEVAQGQVIGTVGNSGTPESVHSLTGEVHLHLELWLDGNHIGEFMRPVETREWLERILR